MVGCLNAFFITDSNCILAQMTTVRLSVTCMSSVSLVHQHTHTVTPLFSLALLVHLSLSVSVSLALIVVPVTHPFVGCPHDTGCQMHYRTHDRVCLGRFPQGQSAGIGWRRRERARQCHDYNRWRHSAIGGRVCCMGEWSNSSFFAFLYCQRFFVLAAAHSRPRQWLPRLL